MHHVNSTAHEIRQNRHDGLNLFATNLKASNSNFYGNNLKTSQNIHKTSVKKTEPTPTFCTRCNGDLHPCDAKVLLDFPDHSPSARSAALTHSSPCTPSLNATRIRRTEPRCTARLCNPKRSVKPSNLTEPVPYNAQEWNANFGKDGSE